MSANRSIASSWLLRAVMLIRTVFSGAGSTLTRTATAPLIGIVLQRIQIRRLWNDFAVLHQSLDVQGESFSCHPSRFLERSARGHTSWKVRKANAEIRIALLMQIGDVIHLLS